MLRTAKMQAIVAGFFLVAIFLVALWDVSVLSAGQPANTASRIIGEWSRGYPVLPFMVGVVIGHVFWPRGG